MKNIYICIIAVTISLTMISGVVSAQGNDTIPPTTILTGVVEGQNYSVNVTITLTPTDVGGSGLNRTLYVINNGTEKKYVGPFNIDDNGRYTVKYWSVDNASNIETPKYINFTINKTVQVEDTTPPTTIISGVTESQNYGVNVTITLAATDVGGSGLNRTLYVINSGSENRYIGPFNISDNGRYTVKYWSVDNANNVETPKYVNFTIDKTEKPYHPVIKDFKVTPSTHINGSNPAIASANVTNGMDNTARVEFGIIDNNGLVGKTIGIENDTIISFDRNVSATQGLYKSEPWPARYTNINNGTGNSTISDIITTYQLSDIPGYIIGRGTFKPNQAGNDTEAILWFNKTTGNLSNVTNLNEEKLDIEDGNSTLRAKIFKYDSKNVTIVMETSKKTFALYNIAGNLDKNNPRIRYNTVPNGNYKAYIIAVDNKSNGTIMFAGIDTIPISTPTSPTGGGAGGDSGSGFNPEGNGTIKRATATPTVTSIPVAQTPTVTATPAKPTETVKTTPKEATETAMKPTPGFEIAEMIAIAVMAIYMVGRNGRRRSR